MPLHFKRDSAAGRSAWRHAKIEDALEFYPISLDHNRRRIRRRVAGKSSGDESSDEDPGQAPVIEKVRETPARNKLSYMIHMSRQFPMTYDWYMPVCTIYMTPCRIQ